MRSTIRLILIVLISSCNSTTQNKDRILKTGEKLITIVDSLTTKDNLAIGKLGTSQNDTSDSLDSQDCIFDQTIQTDEFLKNIKELKGYKWDQNSRTATVVYNNIDTLLISRGGCVHFGVSVEFRLRNDNTDYSEWNNVYKKVLWIANILEKEFAYDEIKKDIDSNKVIIEKYENSDVVTFSNEYLQNEHYEIERFLNPEIKVIILSYYIN